MKFISAVLLKTILSIILIFGIASLSNGQQIGSQTIDQAGYYNLKIGDIDVTVLSDGTLPLNMSKLLFNAHPGEIDSLFKENFQKPTDETSVNAYLIRTSGKLILIDAGCGDLMGNTAGKLLKSLANAGLKPSQIDAVLVTHMHPDHIGGLVKNGKMTFPNATIYFAKVEGAFWLSDVNRENAPSSFKPFFEDAQNAVKPYSELKKVRSVDFGTEIFPGITAIASTGHTAGHTSYKIESNGNKLIILGDLIHSGAVQFADPGITIHFDADAVAAAKSRRQLFNEAATGKFIIAGSHLSFPGLGRLKA